MRWPGMYVEQDREGCYALSVKCLLQTHLFEYLVPLFWEVVELLEMGSEWQLWDPRDKSRIL